MTVRPPKVHRGADELRQVVMPSIPGAFNQQAQFTPVQTLTLITAAGGYVRLQINGVHTATEASSGLEFSCSPSHA